jgi:repressor LexA
MGRRRLTERQKEVLRIIREKIRQSGYPPTVREIGESLGISEKGAYDHLKALERKGYIRRQPRKTRAIEILEPEAQDGEHIRVPILSGITLDEKEISDHKIEGVISLPRGFLGEGELFALKVRGSDMAEIGILDGDYVIARRQREAKPGEVVIVLREDGREVRIMVMPTDPETRTSYTEKGMIRGKVVGLLRRF